MLLFFNIGTIFGVLYCNEKRRARKKEVQKINRAKKQVIIIEKKRARKRFYRWYERFSQFTLCNTFTFTLNLTIRKLSVRVYACLVHLLFHNSHFLNLKIFHFFLSPLFCCLHHIFCRANKRMGSERTIFDTNSTNCFIWCNMRFSVQRAKCTDTFFYCFVHSI